MVLPKRKLPSTISGRVLNAVLVSIAFVCCFQFRPISIGGTSIVSFRPPTHSQNEPAATEPPKQIVRTVLDKKKGLALNLVRSTAKKQLELIADASAPLPLSSNVPKGFRRPPSSLHKIPHQLIFTYKYNLLERKEPLALYQNLQRTIEMYREGWGDEPEAPVWFLNDTDCRSAIHSVKPELLTHFDYEQNGAWKADMCRIAALYLTGGYYFDVDMEVVQVFRPASRDTTFVTVEAGPSFFQSFLATDPKNNILGQALDEMLVYYRKQSTRKTSHLLGPETLKRAFDNVPEEERGKVQLLEELDYDADSTSLPLSRRNAVGSGCKFLVQDPGTGQTIFYSRIVGLPGKCMDVNSPEGRAYILETAKR
jgi:hypothetical protein